MSACLLNPFLTSLHSNVTCLKTPQCLNFLTPLSASGKLCNKVSRDTEREVSSHRFHTEKLLSLPCAFLPIKQLQYGLNLELHVVSMATATIQHTARWAETSEQRQTRQAFRFLIHCCSVDSTLTSCFSSFFAPLIPVINHWAHVRLDRFDVIVSKKWHF